MFESIKPCLILAQRPRKKHVVVRASVVVKYHRVQDGGALWRHDLTTNILSGFQPAAQCGTGDVAFKDFVVESSPSTRMSGNANAAASLYMMPARVFSELLPSLAARRLLTMVCAWWWGRGRLMTVGNSTVGYDGRNFDGWRFLAGAQCRIFWRIFLVPNILANILAGAWWRADISVSRGGAILSPPVTIA